MSTTRAEFSTDEMTSADRLRLELEELERRFVGHKDDTLMTSLKELVRAHVARPPDED
jgi:hypothetical protein